MDTTRRHGPGRGHAPFGALAAAVVALAAITAAPAIGAATEAQQGAQVLRTLQSRSSTCAALKTADFDHVGEYVMERMLGTASTHQAMNRQMAAAMGTSGETQAHVFMGRRFSGCTRGRPPVAFGAMMGMLGAGMMGSASGGSATPGMMNSSARGTGGTMAFDDRSSSAVQRDGRNGTDTVMMVFMGVLIVLAIGGLAAWRPWRRPAMRTPLELLQARYAHGDIDQQEFDLRRHAL